MTHDDARTIHTPGTRTSTSTRRSRSRSTGVLTGERPRVPRLPGTALTTTAEVLDHLVGLVGPRVPASPVAWFTFLDAARRVVPVAVPFDGLPGLPSASTVAEVVDVLGSVMAQHPDGLQVLMALSRPSGGEPAAFERRWANAFWEAADDAGWTVGLVAAVGAHRAAALERGSCAR